MGQRVMDEPEDEREPVPGRGMQPREPRSGPARSRASSPRAGTSREGRPPAAVLPRIGRVISAPSLAWVWGLHGLVSVLIGLLLLLQFGAVLGVIRAILAVWVLITAGGTAWRWSRDEPRSPFLLCASVIGLLAGVFLLLGGGLSLLAIMWTFGGFWVAVGLLELVAWLQGRSPAVEWPWISGIMIFFGIVAVTFPTPLVLVLTLLGSLWAIVLGLIHLVRGLWLGGHAGQLATTPERPSLLRRVLLVGLPAVLLA